MTSEPIPSIEPQSEPQLVAPREKWLALVAFVVVTAFGVALLYAK